MTPGTNTILNQRTIIKAAQEQGKKKEKKRKRKEGQIDEEQARERGEIFKRKIRGALGEKREMGNGGEEKRRPSALPCAIDKNAGELLQPRLSLR